MVLETKDTAEAPELAPPQPPGRCNCASHQTQYALEDRVAQLEARIAELEAQLAQARP